MRHFILGICLLCGFIGGAIGYHLANSPESFSEITSTAQAQTIVTAHSPYASISTNRPMGNSGQTLTTNEQVNINVYKVANRSVVNIDTRSIEYNRFFHSTSQSKGAGSGSIIDRQGHILTNFHVIEDVREIDVTLASGNTYPATLVGHDAEHDIAVLKIDAPPEQLTPISMGSSASLNVGQSVYVLGNPFGLEGTLSTGIISSLNRTLPSRVRDRSMNSIIQTDAAMNPGNSGGPMLDTGARMIGMNVAIHSKTGQNSGIGFAIPVDRLKRIIPELIEHGKIIRADHGIVSIMETEQGLKIVKVTRSGPADRAGLRGFRLVRKTSQQGNMVYQSEHVDRSYADYLLAVNGHPIRTHHEFIEAMDQHKPGQTVTLTIRRAGQEQQLQLTLGEV